MERDHLERNETNPGVDQLNKEGYVVLIKKPGDPNWYGPVECSFSLDVRKNETQYFWSSDHATSNFGGCFKVDGRSDAERTIATWKKTNPDWEFQLWDLQDPLIPITIDWVLYDWACQPAKTLSGVRDKYHHRNLSFAVKSGHDWAESYEVALDQAK